MTDNKYKLYSCTTGWITLNLKHPQGDYCLEFVFPCSRTLPDDDTPVSKHAAVWYLSLICFIKSICWLMYQLNLFLSQICCGQKIYFAAPWTLPPGAAAQLAPPLAH